MAWLLKETEFNTFIGKNMVLNALSETKTCDEHPRHDFQIRVPGVPGWEGGGKYMRMHKQGEDETQLKKTPTFVT